VLQYQVVGITIGKFERDPQSFDTCDISMEVKMMAIAYIVSVLSPPEAALEQ
jgi:hypothetical protein